MDAASQFHLRGTGVIGGSANSCGKSGTPMTLGPRKRRPCGAENVQQLLGGGGNRGRVLALPVLKHGPDEENPAEAGSAARTAAADISLLRAGSGIIPLNECEFVAL